MRYFKKIFSINLALILMLVFAVLCACATFVESYYGNDKARQLIYNAWYFHLVIILLTINVFVCLITYKMYKKLSLFLVHFSFIFIFFGSVITHFYGFEGVVHLRLDNATNSIKSTQTKLSISKNGVSKSVDDFKNDLSLDDIKLQFIEFSSEGSYDFIKSDDLNDKPLLRLNFNFNNRLDELNLPLNECELVDDLNVCFNKTSDGKYINIYIKDEKFYAYTNIDLKVFNQGKYEVLSKEFEFKNSVYFYNGFSFNPKLILTHAKQGYRMSGGDLRVIKLKSFNDEIVVALNESVDYKGYKITWAQDELKLDYKIYLKRFNLEHYPASKSVKDYVSEILILDKDGKTDTKIAMNKVLDYKGIRYFQHSYDEDLKGSILSANKDPGKTPTYIGYFLLFLGCFLNLFSVNIKNMFKALSVILLFSGGLKLEASDLNSHINELNTVITQDLNSRFLPFYSLANDLCNKLGCQDKQNASLEIFKLQSDINYVNEARLIRVKNKQIQKLLGINSEYAKFSDFYEGSSYKLKDEIKKTYSKGEMNYDEFDKALIKIDEAVNIYYLIFTGELFKIIPDTLTNFSLKSPFAQDLSLNAQNVANEYLLALLEAKNTKNYDEANKIIQKIKQNQAQLSELPSQMQIKAMVFLSKIDGFYILCKLYLALFLLSLFFLNKKQNIIFYLSLFLFLSHFALLLIRGFVAGYAPLSNTYESLIYIALSTIFAGLVFRKNILLTLSLLLCTAILFTAHLNDINPQITNLAPVLNSPYLSIHVSLISASYGFFAIASMISFVYLLGFKNPKHIIHARLSIHFGLLLLVCGNFLGGIWANESWGRYWGWDSKETWSLVSILIYSILLHLRFSKIYNDFLFALLSFLAFASILMTYFGVNYYLVGKHSYAGEQSNLESPLYLVISLIVLAIFSLVSFIIHRRKNV